MSMSEQTVVQAGALPRLHPVNTLMEEHRFIMTSVRELAALVERLKSAGSFPDMGGDREALKGIAHHLVDAESHHEREENVLFPRMQARGVTDLPARMKAEHGELRTRKRRLFQLANGAAGEDFAAFREEVITIGEHLTRALSEHISTEDTVVYPRALEVLDPSEWDAVKRGCDAIGYCCFKPDDQERSQASAALPMLELDLRAVPMTRKLGTILEAWESLAPGQSMRLTNNKRPEPLQLMFKTRERGKHEWSYEKDGPEAWIAVIRKL